MKLSILKEINKNEARVAASTDSVKSLINLGFEVSVEAGAGEKSSISDDDYKKAGAKIVKSAGTCAKSADIILKIQAPTKAEIKNIAKGTILICAMDAYNNIDVVKALAEKNITTFAMEFVPRITRAQSMDILSSQSNLSGYRAVLDAVYHYGKSMPMLMTAAGTIAPAKTFVMGAGVAGLQAIATAKRLGAVVSATDVRAVAKEQVESLGANFVMVEQENNDGETAGGYAKEMSDEYKQKQAKLIAKTIAKQDIVITTALIPGRPAPVLVTQDMVKSMKPGSVIVDLAAAQGGNCPLTKADEVIEKHGVTIIGYTNMPSRLAAEASKLFAKNLYNFVALMVKDGKISPDYKDEIIKGSNLTKDGKVLIKAIADLTGEAKKKAPAKKKAAPKKTDAKKTTVKTAAKKTTVKTAANKEEKGAK